MTILIYSLCIFSIPKLVHAKGSAKWFAILELKINIIGRDGVLREEFFVESAQVRASAVGLYLIGSI